MELSDLLNGEDTQLEPETNELYTTINNNNPGLYTPKEASTTGTAAAPANGDNQASGGRRIWDQA